MTPKNHHILGIDPGTNLLGYAILSVEDRKSKIVVSGVMNLSKYQPFRKLGKIYTSLVSLFQEYKIDALAIETAFYGKNVQSMLKLGRVQGLAIGIANSKNVDIFEYAPLRVKQMVTGKGSASKPEVQKILQNIFPLYKAQHSQSFDESDALAVAYCHYLHISHPLHKQIKEENYTKKSASKKSSQQRKAWADYLNSK